MEDLIIPTMESADEIVQTFEETVRKWAKTDKVSEEGVRSFVAVSGSILIQELRRLVCLIGTLNERYERLRQIATRKGAEIYDLRAENATLRQQLAYYAGGDGKGLEA